MWFRSFKDSVKNLEELAEKIASCEERGHPHKENVLVQYTGNNRPVMVQCDGCSHVYKRPANAEERDSYSRMFDLVIDV